MIKEWNDSLVGKLLTNSHWKELSKSCGGFWVIRVLYVGRSSFFGEEFDANFDIKGAYMVPMDRMYGHKQFDWEIFEEEKESTIRDGGIYEIRFVGGKPHIVADNGDVVPVEWK